MPWSFWLTRRKVLRLTIAGLKPVKKGYFRAFRSMNSRCIKLTVLIYSTNPLSVRYELAI